MDPDQDLLDRLDAREEGGTKTVVAVIAAVSLFAGLIGFFTLQFELRSGREISLDGGVLIAMTAGFGLFIAYRMFK
jgi:hypothetical protein